MTAAHQLSALACWRSGWYVDCSCGERIGYEDTAKAARRAAERHLNPPEPTGWRVVADQRVVGGFEFDSKKAAYAFLGVTSGRRQQPGVYVVNDGTYVTNDHAFVAAAVGSPS